MKHGDGDWEELSWREVDRGKVSPRKKESEPSESGPSGGFGVAQAGEGELKVPIDLDYAASSIGLE